MKKNEMWSILVILLMGVIIIVSAVTFISPAFGEAVGLDGNLIYGWEGAAPYLLVSMIVGIIVSAILSEIGHVLGALIGGYRVTEVDILGCAIVKNEKGKFRFRFKSFNGLTGETKVLPKRENASLIAYCILPTVLFFAMIAISFMLISFGSVNGTYLEPCLLTIITINSVIILYQIFPFELDSLNDGYRFVVISGKNKEAQIAFNQMMLIEEKIQKGEKNWEMPKISAQTVYGGKIYLMDYQRTILNKDYSLASQILETILSESKVVEVLSRAKAEKVFTLAMIQLDLAINYYNDELTAEDKKIIFERNDLDYLRCYLIVAALIEQSSSEIEYAKNRIEKILSKDRDDKYQEQKQLIEDAYALIKKQGLKDTLDQN